MRDCLTPLIFYNLGLTSTLPTSQAGHQTHQITTWVHSPFTCHPKAASASTSFTCRPEYQHAIHTTTGGDTVCSSIVEIILRLVERGASLLSGMYSGGPTNVKGVESRPTNRASEKFSVARVAKNMPRRSREIHWMRTWCCIVRKSF